MKHKNILVLTSWSYHDALIQTYTLPYLKIMHKYLPAGSSIHLVTQEQGKNAITDEAEIKEVEQELSQYNIRLIPYPYIPFGGKAAVKWLGGLIRLRKIVKQKSITHIHSFCTPAGAIGYTLSSITKKPLVLDSFEPHAEAMVENGTWQKNGLPYRILLKLEALQYKRAKYIISATAGMRRYAAERYGGQKKMWVKPACVNLELFAPAKVKQSALLRELKLEDKIICVYAGKFGGIYLDQEVFDFFKVAFDYWGERFRVLMLTNQKREDLDRWCRKAGLPPEIVIDKFVPHVKVADYLGLGDFAITPVKPVPTKRYCTPIKNGEYWALGLPVVSTANISDDSDIIVQNDVGALLADFSPEAYLQAVQQIDRLLKEPKDMLFNKIRNIAQQYRSFKIADSVYQEIYGAN